MNLKRFLMLATLLVLPTGVTKCLYAATPCNVTDAAFKMGQVVRTSEGACLVWFCSNNHGWDKYWLCNTYSGITGAVVDHLNALTQASQAQRDSEWAALLATPPAAGTPDDRLTQAAALVPVPTDIPLDGLVVQNQNAYRLTSPTNAAPVFQLAGSVPLGTVCDTAQKFGKYYRVDRTKVVIPKGALQAPAYYASCDL